MPPGIPILLFSNIDEVIDAPEAEAASVTAALGGLDREAVALVLCSSRTRAEIEAFQQALAIRHPFVCERGCAAFVPAGYFPAEVPGARDVAGYHAIEVGRPHADIVQTLHQTAARLQIEIDGFSEMAVEDVARECQVSLLQARLAKLREYGECFRIVDPAEATRQRLFKALEGARLRCAAGGSYHSVTAAVDPGLAMRRIHTLFQQANGAVISVGSSEVAAEFAARMSSPPNGAGDHGNGQALRHWAQAQVGVVATLRRWDARTAM